MLSFLLIKNFATISELKVTFYEGLNALTGETGAGKSIIIGAINLILGAKASTDIIRTGASKTTVVAQFILPPTHIIYNKLQDIGIDVTPQDPIIIARQVLSSGKSKSFINSQPVTLTVLKELATNLVDISSQREHQYLLNPINQLKTLDKYANLEPLLEQYKKTYNQLKQKYALLKKLKEIEKNKFQEQSFLEFAISEIEEANLQEDEDILLEAEKERLENYNKIFSAISQSYNLLYQQEQSAAEQIDAAIKLLSNVKDYDHSINDNLNTLIESRYQLDNVIDFLSNYLDNMEFSPERLEEIYNRLAQIDLLKRKYGNSIKEILQFYEEAKEKLAKLESNEEEIVKVEEEIEEIKETLRSLALELHYKRVSYAKKLSEAIKNHLIDLAMPKVRFEVKVYQEETPNSFIEVDGKPVKIFEWGIDLVEFLFSSNPGEELKPLTKIISGGELSRVILSSKIVLNDDVDTIIFDEVDTGISGETAKRVALKLKELANSKQVITITHSPQIASKATHHFSVRKYEEHGQTFTTIKKLSYEERIREIARMIHGDSITEISLRHAQELIGAS